MRNQGYSQVSRRPKPAIVAAIVLGHVVGLYFLARALVPDVTGAVERDVLEAFTVTVTAPPEEPPPPPPPEVEPEPDTGAQGDPGKEAVPQDTKEPDPPIKLKKDKPAPRATSTGTAKSSGAKDKGEGTGAAGTGEGTGSGNSGSGSGNDRVAVTKPSVRSGELNTARDFPVPEGGRKTRFGKSVIVHFTVMPDGTASRCSVASSGVDSMTTGLVCGLVRQKIRFNPATNAAGQPVEARYGYKVDFIGG